MNLNDFYFVPALIPAVAFVLVAQWACRKNDAVRRTVQLTVLLAYSLVMIALFGRGVFLCALFVAVAAYLFGILVERCGRKKPVMVLGVIVLVGTLCFFKYAGFFVTLLSRSDRGSTLRIIMPIGISFYVFSAVSYVADVYVGKIQAEQNVLHFALYILFFPKFISGPIVRSADFLLQTKAYAGINKMGFLHGVQIFIFGLFKKIVLADRLSVFVDDVFFSPLAFNTATVVLAAVSYSFQIYLDFSGYSDMAIGAAKIFGFNFEPNFNVPYLAQNISDFWRRWHISLSSWLRDYVYIPLGGSRVSPARVYLNLFLVMTVSGIWHGAGLTFILWGVLHGLASCLHRFVSRHFPIHKSAACVVTGTLLTFVLVTLFWIPFRSESLSDAAEFYRALFTIHGGIAQYYTWSFIAIFCTALAFFVVLRHTKKQGFSVPQGFYPLLDLGKFWHLVLFFVFIGITVITGYYGNTAFIYGQF